MWPTVLHIARPCNHAIHAFQVTVDVFRTRSEQDVKDLFVDINSAEPVKLVDMPGEGADDDAAAVLAEAVEVLAAR